MKKLTLSLTILLCLSLCTAFFFHRRSSSGGGEDITTGLVVHLQMDSDFTDDSGNANNGTHSGGDGADYVTGLASGQAWDVDSVGEVVTITQDTTINDLTTLTIAACINFDSWGESALSRIVDKDSGGWQLELDDPTDRIRFRYERWSTTAGEWRPASGTTLSTGVTYHVAVSYDAGSTTNDPILYLDGSAYGSLTEMNTPAGTLDSETDPLYVGNTASGNTFDGRIDDLRIYNIVKTAAQIAAMAALCP